MNFNIFWGFKENEYFLGYDDFGDIFGGSSQILTIFRGNFYTFKGFFFRSRYRMRDIFWGAKISNIFWGA